MFLRTHLTAIDSGNVTATQNTSRKRVRCRVRSRKVGTRRSLRSALFEAHLEELEKGGGTAEPRLSRFFHARRITVCAFRLFDLPTHHADPFDRQLIAQALAEDIAVVTLDEAFLTYEGLKVVW